MTVTEQRPCSAFIELQPSTVTAVISVKQLSVQVLWLSPSPAWKCEPLTSVP